MVRCNKRWFEAIDGTKPGLLPGWQFVEMHDIRLAEDIGVPLPPFEKGDRGGLLAFTCRQRTQIALSPPFPKGEMARVELLQI